MEVMNIMVSLLILLYFTGCTMCSNIVLMSKGVTDGVLYLNCSVFVIKYSITLFSPTDVESQTYFASCDKPFDKTGIHRCNRKEDIINLDTNTVTFKISPIDSFSKYGEWKCVHDNSRGYITLGPPEKCEQPQCVCTVPTVFAVIFGVVLLIGLLFALKHFKIWELIKKRNVTDVEATPLLGNQPKTICVCSLCKRSSACAICYNCNSLFCEICGHSHQKKEDHILLQMDHINIITRDRSDAKCKICDQNLSDVVCISCKRIMCFKCNCDCNENKVIRKLVEPQAKQSRHIKTSGGTFTSIKTNSFSILSENDRKCVRVCGISVLNGSRIVIADAGRNDQLKVFDFDGNCCCERKLEQEPRGLTSVESNKVAVSFAYEMEIRLFEVKTTAIEELKNEKLSLKDIGKPFDIAYDNDHFAIETGEGDYGFITILHKNGTEKCRIQNTSSYGYFTGNTIRLALNMYGNLVYVSSMSIEKMSCVDFKGYMRWSQPVPSPRGIIYNHSKILNNRKILLASKRCKAIYLIDECTGNDEILISEEDIKAPRYMAYDPNERLLWVDIDHKEIFVYELKQ